MIKKIVLVLVLLVVIICVGLLVTLINNQAHLLKPPGLKQRLTVFFNQNTASTADNHPFPELTTPVYTLSARHLFKVVLSTGARLGWHIAAVDDENLKVEFEVSTPVFGFVDDVTVQVVFLGTDKSSLYISSASRKGTGDLAANSGHIQTLLAALNAGPGR